MPSALNPRSNGISIGSNCGSLSPQLDKTYDSYHIQNTQNLDSNIYQFVNDLSIANR